MNEKSNGAPGLSRALKTHPDFIGNSPFEITPVKVYLYKVSRSKARAPYRPRIQEIMRPDLTWEMLPEDGGISATPISKVTTSPQKAAHFRHESV
jgi:hypothetical protein